MKLRRSTSSFFAEIYGFENLQLQNIVSPPTFIVLLNNFSQKVQVLYSSTIIFLIEIERLYSAFINPTNEFLVRNEPYALPCCF